MGLERLAADPDAPVVVTEGERAADAAARFFPSRSRRHRAAARKRRNKSDWTPLAGRRVLIWPDNDEAGGKYAREVSQRS